MILIITEPKGAFIVLTFLGISAYIFSTITRKKLKKWSLERLNHSTIINKCLIEGLGGIKDLIIFNRSNYFYDRFSVENEKYSRIITKVNFLGTVPRLYLEMLSIIGISILIFVASSTNSHGTLVPILGIFAAAAFRIIPSLNSMMNSIQQIRFSSSTINLLYDELIKLDINKKQLIKTNLNEFKFERSILISNLNFRYDSTEREVLKNINLEIIKGESIGFIGTSGSGKSTLIDLIIGLYKTEAESIFVDGVSIRNNEIAWRKKIGYVPQSIFLIDDSLIKNIAFGIPENEINLEKVKNAIEAAQLHEFVNNLPANIETSVGERGVRISGGQKQRIGIARALYNNPEILILDEATSALDVKTENEIMQTIQELKGKITIIIVAHRLVTLENCDRVIVLEYGKIKEVGESENILSKYK
jgi:ABC-type bacteriocin/lantibiotic exporter with double-glycine peptidase domain